MLALQQVSAHYLLNQHLRAGATLSGVTTSLSLILIWSTVQTSWSFKNQSLTFLKGMKITAILNKQEWTNWSIRFDWLFEFSLNMMGTHRKGACHFQYFTCSMWVLYLLLHKVDARKKTKTLSLGIGWGKSWIEQDWWMSSEQLIDDSVASKWYDRSLI